MHPGDIDCNMKYESSDSPSFDHLELNSERPLLEPGGFVSIEDTKMPKDTTSDQPCIFLSAWIARNQVSRSTFYECLSQS
jgi:hypothetical protein